MLSQNHPIPFLAERGATTRGFVLGEQAHAKPRVLAANGARSAAVRPGGVRLGIGPPCRQGP